MHAVPAELLQGLLLPAEAAINHLLRYDPAAQHQLSRLQGRLLALTINGVTSLYLRILDGSVSLSFHNDAQADAHLCGSAAEFMALATARDAAGTLINSAIDMDGDSEFAIALTRIAQQLDIDWEAVIAPVTGGLLAHQLGKGLRGLLHWGQSTGRTAKTSIKDYLEDEAQLLTPQPLLQQFADEVDDLKLATDRLSARIDRLIEASAQTKE